MIHGLMENRSDLIVDVETTPGHGSAEREATLAMLSRSVRKAGATVGADKGHATIGFVEDCIADPRTRIATRDAHQTVE